MSKKKSDNILTRSLPRVLVIGDVMLDHYVYGTARRISPEAPIPVVEFENEKFVPGGAANVANNLASLNVNVHLFGFVGCDVYGGILVRRLAEAELINYDYVLKDKDRHTTLKERIVCTGQQIVRVDRESHRRITDKQAKALITRVLARMSKASAVVLSDYAKGTITQKIVDAVVHAANKQNIPVVMNMKPANAVNPFQPFAIQVNRKEAFELAQSYDDGSMGRLREAAAMIAVRWEPKNVIVTLGANGIYLYRRDGGQEPTHLPTEAKDVVDVSGAGDTVLAAFVSKIVQTGGMVETALAFANKCAGVVVGKHGTATLRSDELAEIQDRI